MVAGNPPNTSQSNTESSESQLTQSKKDQVKTGKAGSLKKKKMTDKEQSKKFIEIAKQLETEKNRESFEKLMGKITKPVLKDPK